MSNIKNKANTGALNQLVTETIPPNSFHLRIPTVKFETEMDHRDKFAKLQS